MVYQEGSFGENGVKQLRNLIQNNSICLASVIEAALPFDRQKVRVAISSIRIPPGRVYTTKGHILSMCSKSHTQRGLFVCWLLACLKSHQQVSVSQGRICSDNFTCCHTEIEVADQTFQFTQSQYTATGPTSRSTDPVTPGAWQGSHWRANL